MKSGIVPEIYSYKTKYKWKKSGWISTFSYKTKYNIIGMNLERFQYMYLYTKTITLIQRYQRDYVLSRKDLVFKTLFIY